MLLILVLAAVAIGLAWLALETRAVHRAIDRYTEEMRRWQQLVQGIDQHQHRDDSQ